MCSLPRNACTIGAFSLRASSMTSACAPAQPAPQNSVTRDAWLRRSASCSTSRRARPQHGRGGHDPFGDLGVDVHQRDVAGHDDDRDAALGDRDPDGALENLRQLLRIGDELDVVAAFLEQAFRMGRLEIVDADFGARDVGGDRQHRHAVALAIEQAVDQMQIARAATAGADRQAAGEMGLGAGREGGGLFVPHMDPVDGFPAPQRIGEAVERVADDAIDALDAGLLEGFDEIFGGCPAHVANPPDSFRLRRASTRHSSSGCAGR